MNLDPRVGGGSSPEGWVCKTPSGARASSLFWFALVVLIVAGCRKSDDAPAPDNQKEETKAETEQAPDASEGDDQGDREPDTASAKTPMKREPAVAIGAWPQRYQPLLRGDAIGAALIEPAAFAAELAQAGGTLSAPGELSAALGDLGLLLEPETWAERGLDPTQPVFVTVTAGEKTGLPRVANLVAKAVQDGDTKPVNDAEGLAKTGFGLRFAIAAEDPDRALEALAEGLASVPSREVSPVDGYPIAFGLGGDTFVAIKKVDGFLVIDSAILPWLSDDAGRLERGAEIVRELSAPSPATASVGLPGPTGDYDGFVAVDAEKLAAADAALIAAGKTFDRGRLTSARVAHALLGAGPFRSLSLRFDSDGKIVVSTYFTDRLPDLYDALRAQTSLEVEDPMLAFGFAPAIADTKGLWAEGGLAASDDVSLGDLVQMLTLQEGIVPFVAPVWLTTAPALVWRDLVPVAARYVEPGALERIEVMIGDAISEENLEAAVLLVDQGGVAETHQHGLACLTQRRPVQGRCRDDRIKVGSVSTTPMGTKTLHYLVDDADDRLAITASPSETLLKALTESPLKETDDIGHARVHLDRLAASGIGKVFGEPLVGAAEVIDSIHADLTIDPDGLHWHVSVQPQISLTRLIAVTGATALESLERSREFEATVNLEALAAAASTFHATGGLYPIVSAEVCSAGAREDRRLVPPTDSDWTQEPWRSLEHRIIAPHLFKYCYVSSSDGRAYWASAEAVVGDPPTTARFCVHGQTKDDGTALPGEVVRLDGGNDGSVTRCAPQPETPP